MARDDPYTGFRFVVQIIGAPGPIGGFSEVTGLQAETETEDFREGGVNDFVRKIIKFTKYPNLVLKRGITENETLSKWHQDVIAGKILMADIAIVLNDVQIQRNKTWRWEFSKAFPVKWSGSDLNATGNSMFIESVEFAHHGMKVGPK